MRLMFTLFAVGLAACTESSLRESGLEFEILDSAGVRIVRTLLPLEESETGWSVSPRPDLIISTPPVEGEYVLHWMRSALRLADGRIVAISEGTKQLLYFDSAGTFLKAVGRAGDGPGEFRGPIQLGRLPGDTLVVWDRVNGRVSRFSGNGEFLGSVVPTEEGFGTLLPTGFRWGGLALHVPTGLMAWGAISGPSNPQEMPTGRLVRESMGVVISPDEGGSGVFLGPIPGTERFFLEPHLGGPAFFGGEAVVAYQLSPTRIILGDNKIIDVKFYTPEGDLVLVIRDAVLPDPVTDEDVAWETRYISTDWIPTRVTGRADVLAKAMPLPERKPAFDALIVDSEGYLWMKEYTAHNPNPIRYRIYSPEGIRVGSVRLPGHLRVSDIGKDYVLGIGYDLDHVETLQMFHLKRPDAN